MAKIDELLETIDTLTVVELAELVKGIEENLWYQSLSVALYLVELPDWTCLAFSINSYCVFEIFPPASAGFPSCKLSKLPFESSILLA